MPSSGSKGLQLRKLLPFHANDDGGSSSQMVISSARDAPTSAKSTYKSSLSTAACEACRKRKYHQLREEKTSYEQVYELLQCRLQEDAEGLLLIARLSLAIVDLSAVKNTGTRQSLRYQFLAEARRLWELETGKCKLTTIHAALLFNAIYNINAMDKIGWAYTLQGVAIAHKL